jgi:hypothetical protein
MFTKALAHAGGQSRVGYVTLGVVAAIVALGTYLVAERGAAKAPPRTPPRVRTAHAARSEAAPSAAEFALVLVSVSNAFAKEHGTPERLAHADCVQGSSGHYMCSYVVNRPRRKGECHLVQAHWGEEPNSSFTVVLSGRVKRCGSLREAVRSLP